MYITDEKFPEIILESVKNVELANKVTNTIRKEDGTVLGYIIKYDDNKLLKVYPFREVDIGQFYVAIEIHGLKDYGVVFEDGKELYMTDSINKTETDADLPTMIGLTIAKLANRFDTIKIRPRVPVLDNKFILDGSRNDLENFKDYLDLLLDNNQTSGFVKDADGNTQPITTDELKQCIKQIREFGLILYQKKWAKEAEIMNCTSVDEVKAIDITLI